MRSERWYQGTKFFVIWMGWALAFPLAIPAQEPEARAVVVDLAGEVRSQAAGDLEWTAVEQGAQLEEGTKLHSGEGASALIEFPPGHRAKLHEKTVILLSQLDYGARREAENTTIHLAMGRILNSVKKLRSEDSEYAVRTPTTVAAVRGTVYEVGYDPETRQTSVKVLEGMIEMESRLGRRLSARLREFEKAGVGREGDLAPAEALSDQERQELQDSSQDVQESGAAEGESAPGQAEGVQSGVMERLDAIDARQSDEARALQLERLRAEDDDD